MVEYTVWHNYCDDSPWRPVDCRDRELLWKPVELRLDHRRGCSRTTLVTARTPHLTRVVVPSRSERVRPSYPQFPQRLRMLISSSSMKLSRDHPMRSERLEPACASINRPASTRPQTGVTHVKFQVNRDVFSEAVSFAVKLLPQRTPCPILSGVLIEATDDGLDPVVVRLRGLRSHRDRGRGRRAGQRARLRPAARRDRQPASRTLRSSLLDRRRPHHRRCGSAHFTLLSMPVEEYPTLPEVSEQIRCTAGRGLRRPRSPRSPSPRPATTSLP